MDENREASSSVASTLISPKASLVVCKNGVIIAMKWLDFTNQMTISHLLGVALKMYLEGYSQRDIVAFWRQKRCP